MTRLGVLVTRRFTSRASGREEVTELVRAVELGIPPVPGMRLAFPDGGECTVSIVRHRCGLAAVAGVIPTEVELIACKEPAAGLEAALTAGWQRVFPSELAPASV
jgi:hypothetical protein